MIETHVHLVRHGEVDNPRKLSYGRLPGFPLSAEGRAQATVSARYLRESGGRARALLTSPLTRARESAAICGEALGLAPVVEDRLIELGSWRDGLPRALSPLTYARRFFDPDARRKSEPAHAAMARMRDAVERARAALTEDGDAAVLVSHQSPIWLCRVSHEREHRQSGLVMRMAPWAYVNFPCGLASVTTLVFRGGALRHVRYFAP